MRPLIWAIAKRNLDGFRILLEQGASPDDAANLPNRTYSMTVTSIAAVLKDTRYLKMALEHGADPNAKPEVGNSIWGPLNHAIYVSHFENVKILVEPGVDLRLEPAPAAQAQLGGTKIPYSLLFIAKRCRPRTVPKDWPSGTFVTNRDTRGQPPSRDCGDARPEE